MRLYETLSKKKADAAGFEPAICGLGGRRLIQLGHAPSLSTDHSLMTVVAIKALPCHDEVLLQKLHGGISQIVFVNMNYG